MRYGETSGLEGDGADRQCVALSRLGDRGIQQRHAVRPLCHAATGRRATSTARRGTIISRTSRATSRSAFLRLAPWDRSNLVAADVRQNYLNEVTSATGSIFLGLTIGCARCHDHKYDPIPTRDFYRLQAFFNAIRGADDVDVPYRDKAFAARPQQKIREYEKRLKRRTRETGLDEIEQRLLQEADRGRSERAEGARRGSRQCGSAPGDAAPEADASSPKPSATGYTELLEDAEPHRRSGREAGARESRSRSWCG